MLKVNAVLKASRLEWFASNQQSNTKAKCNLQNSNYK